MSSLDIERLRKIRTLPSLVKYLRDDLRWPIDQDAVEDDLTFEYQPEELGITPESAVGIKEIKQLRPLDTRQPWGVFWVNFEKKRLPVVMLRRVLGHLVVKKRASADRAKRRAWHLHDLLFISSYGEEHDRAVTFAHFAQDTENASDLPVLKVLGWDGGDTVLHLADAHRTMTEKLRWPANPEDLAVWREQWASVFTLRHREVISTTQELVEELAKLATSIRKRADSILARESDRGPMRRLYGAFKTALIHDLSEDEFADVIAQTISYGLLAARFSSKGGIAIQSLVDMIPPTNPFLRELLAELLAVAGRKKGAFDFDELDIQDVVDLLNRANAEAVKVDFGNKSRNEDPVIFFYQDFLHVYDRQKRVKRGAFYTPTPVVSYIVRSVHELLQTEFGLEDGLADTTTWGEMVKRIKGLSIPEGAKPGEPFVLILDPATGTATFLVEVIEVIFTHLEKKWADEGQSRTEVAKAWNKYVPKHLLPRLYGYELMMAPYTIAHMKLGLKLQEINARLGQPDFEFTYTDRAHVYLTNSLEPAGDDKQGVLEGIFPALAHEAAAVNRVKRSRRFTVVVGNPPYSVSSQNEGAWILDLCKDFKSGLEGERNLQPLSDDYIKFLRFGLFLMEKSRIGLLGMITNREYLQGVIHRSVRRRLLSAASSIAITDLHGQRGELIGAGKADQNVFAIEKGVAIGVFFFGAPRKTGITYGESLGSESEKATELQRAISATLSVAPLAPTPPHFFFKPWQSDFKDEYDEYPSLLEFFARRPVTGFATHRDSFAIDFSKSVLTTRLKRFLDAGIPDATIRNDYNLTDTRDWQLNAARIHSRRDPSILKRVVLCAYRPFDCRWIIYSDDVLEYSRRDAMQHVSQKTPALICSRIVKDEEYAHVFVSAHPVEKIFLSPKSSNNAQVCLSGTAGHICDSLIDVDPDVVSPRGQLSFVPEPAHLFRYAYAILHSPTYRTRYAEFLKIDFPRLPLTSSLDLFRALGKLGGELVALHLMESPKLDERITKWAGGKNPRVEKVSYSKQTVWIDKAKTQGFEGVPENVWEFHIGGYQVCEKWLKDRGPKKGNPGRTLAAEDIDHYQKIVVALNETIRRMGEIDEVIEAHGGWPGAFATKDT